MSAGCSEDTPPIDSNCSDPAYRAAHPDECANFTLLLLKPSYSLTEPGKTVNYTVFLRANGTEIELEQGLEFSSSNEGAAEINDLGVATGIAAGSTTISVTWQNLSAHAQLDVVASCAETNQHFRIIIDNSPSMNQAFSSSYATKLSFSKSIAREFCNSINYSKDDVAVSKFADDYTELLDWGTDADPARAKIQAISIAPTGDKTNLADALQEAIDDFPEDGVRVIVLFTDGEWSGDDPAPIATAYKEAGGFLVIVATRAWGDFFADMAEIASGGFLLSAYGDTEDTILESLSSLKSLMCGAECEPGVNEAPYAQLNYTDWINWDASRVIRDEDGNQIDEIFPDDPGQELDSEGRPAGYPDLVGLGVYDRQPGNGLYADLQGTGAPGYLKPGQPFGYGRLTSKEEFDFENGKTYRFTLDVGASANGFGSWTLRVRVGDGVDELITITQGAGQIITEFAPYDFEWVQSGDLTGRVIIEQTAISASGWNNVGLLIDDILLENVTDVDVMLEDSFDTENPTTIPPSPGYYGGCATIEPQSSDPTPPTPRFEE